MMSLLLFNIITSNFGYPNELTKGLKDPLWIFQSESSLKVILLYVILKSGNMYLLYYCIWQKKLKLLCETWFYKTTSYVAFQYTLVNILHCQVNVNLRVC